MKLLVLVFALSVVCIMITSIFRYHLKLASKHHAMAASGSAESNENTSEASEYYKSYKYLA